MIDFINLIFYPELESLFNVKFIMITINVNVQHNNPNTIQKTYL